MDINDLIKQQEQHAQELPPCSPDVIKIIQHFLNLANANKIHSVLIIGIDAVGNIYSKPVVPLIPAALHVAMGACEMQKLDLADYLKSLRATQPASPIIRPSGFNGMPPGG